MTEPRTATNKRKDIPKGCPVTSVIREGAAKPRSAGFTGPCRPSTCPVWELLKRRALGPPTPRAASQGDLWPCLPGPCPGAPRPRHRSQAGLKPRNGPAPWAFHQGRGPPGTLSMRAWASLTVMEGVQKSMLTTWPEYTQGQEHSVFAWRVGWHQPSAEALVTPSDGFNDMT